MAQIKTAKTDFATIQANMSQWPVAGSFLYGFDVADDVFKKIDSAGVISSIGGDTLAEVLVNGSSTGDNYFTTPDTTSKLGILSGGQIEWTSDNGGYAESWIYGYTNAIQIGYGNLVQLVLDSTKAELETGAGGLNKLTLDATASFAQLVSGYDLKGFYVTDIVPVSAGRVVVINDVNTLIKHNIQLTFDSPIYQFTSATPGSLPYFDGTSNLVASYLSQDGIDSILVPDDILIKSANIAAPLNFIRFGDSTAFTFPSPLDISAHKTLNLESKNINITTNTPTLTDGNITITSAKNIITTSGAFEWTSDAGGYLEGWIYGDSTTAWIGWGTEAEVKLTATESVMDYSSGGFGGSASINTAEMNLSHTTLIELACANIDVSLLPVGPGSVAIGELYVDTAANVLAAGDYVVARRVV